MQHQPLSHSGTSSSLIIGLTGGIGSGKTAASNLFAEKGIEVIDADVIARAALEPGSPLLEDVYEHFGSQLQLADGSLDRAALRKKIFNNHQEKIWLEELVHPWVREEVVKQLKTAKGGYLILASPLLIESHQDQLVDRILVIDLPKKLQIERTCQRDNNQEELVTKIMANQLERQERLAKADDVIDNSKGLNELKKQVNYWHDFYQQLARRAP
ncbi:dephospho-CoA kinase [Marinospirillum celere]|uniref:Dephospho-CoA kinase n=1 Tax=Marinospirillum celere TaxID=1122252 RepID=A0A1I1FZ05_9GAMM|nr:dephospho-CoA kinase [Marinospirillum celere]SFC04829.1 dephospho-CoA kinase [Marinospirillum celere]